MMSRWFPSHWLRALLHLLLGAALVPAATSAYINLATSDRRYTDTAQVPTERVAIIFGAGVLPNGSPTPMLADRVQAGIDLYNQKRVSKLLMTGDNSRIDYNEVWTMQQYATEHGVPAKDITLDHAGFSTYESCYRAREIFGVKQAIVVTQQYHLPRAVYTCRQLGVDAIGLGTPDWGRYGGSEMTLYTAREVLATLKAVVEVKVTRPLPTFLGRYEGIKDW